MKTSIVSLILVVAASASPASLGWAQTPTPTPISAPAAVSGSIGEGDEWQMTVVTFGIPASQRMSLHLEGVKISGWIFSNGKRRAITGTVDAGRVRFERQQGDEKATYTGKIDGAEMSGMIQWSGGQPVAEEPPSPWHAKRATSEKDRPRAPRTIDFEPTEFHRVFSASIPPVLRIWPGDVLRTRTVDAGGVDEKGKMRVLGGNPQTGPFYVEGVMPGDVLAVHVRRLRLNRTTAVSDDNLVDRSVTNDYAAQHRDDNSSDVVWNLDLARGTASPAKTTEHLKGLAVPVRPMLGCIGVAPGPAGAAIRTGDSGGFGGNMDFNEIREGATVYLAAAQPGALLYFGDGHALQGDGELNGNALETSLDVEISVDVLREKRIAGPRVENADSMMAVGLSGSLDDAFREAGSSLATWLQEDYKLTGSETAILLGATVEYQIAEVADRNVAVVAKIRKKYLPMR